MLLCHTGLDLSSPVAGFGVSLPSVCFLLRVPFVVFFFSLFVVSGLAASNPKQRGPYPNMRANEHKWRPIGSNENTPWVVVTIPDELEKMDNHKTKK